MSEKEQTTPMEEREEKTEAEAAAEAAESAAPEEAVPETYTLTREQMEKMEGLAAKLAETEDRHLRLMAEYDNYRKRTQKEKEGIYQDAKMDTIAPFLEVFDNLERAVMQPGDDDNIHKKGMEMIFNQLKAILEKMGVAIEDPQGQVFDPAKHNAVMHIEDENLGENIVAQVFQKGFLLGDKVIRFATVQVAN